MSRELQPPAPAFSPAVRPRLESVDLLRGLVMVLMALDHTRDFFSNSPFDPLDLQRTSPALFFTRWVTHICAPTFVFLAGTGAFLSRTRGKTTRQLSWFLLTRGAWLVLLELTYVNWIGWSFHVNFHWFGLQVVWAIGWSMIALAGLVWLPLPVILGIGLTLIALHNALDNLAPQGLGPGAILWRLLHAGGVFAVAPDVRFGVGYPLIPWIGVMAAGYGFGPLLLREEKVRRRCLPVLGLALILVFVAVRATNLYGDPSHWSQQKNALFTLFSFVNCTKYPPSLCFVLMTLGPALLLLALWNRGAPALFRPLLVFGRVPLFFYLIHLPLIHALSVLAKHFQPHPATAAAQGGFGLGNVYVFWVLVLALLYPVCRWFAAFKRRNSHRSWVSYV